MRYGFRLPGKSTWSVQYCNIIIIVQKKVFLLYLCCKILPTKSLWNPLMMRTFDFSELELVCKQKAVLFGKSGRERLAIVVIIAIGKNKTSQSRPGETWPEPMTNACRNRILLSGLLKQGYCKQVVFFHIYIWLQGPGGLMSTLWRYS